VSSPSQQELGKTVTNKRCLAGRERAASGARRRKELAALYRAQGMPDDVAEALACIYVTDEETSAPLEVTTPPKRNSRNTPR
jgi:hypothetical protein